MFAHFNETAYGVLILMSVIGGFCEEEILMGVGGVVCYEGISTDAENEDTYERMVICIQCGTGNVF